MKKCLFSILLFLQAAALLAGAGLLCLGARGEAALLGGRERLTVPLAAESVAATAEADLPENGPQSLEALQGADEGQLDEWAETLERFDGRDFGIVTPARNQYTTNICWAYGAVGAVETNILRKGIDKSATKDTLDLDEMVAAYACAQRDGEEDPLWLTANDTYDYGSWNQGDNSFNAFSAMTQGFALRDECHLHSSTGNAVLKEKLEQSRYYVKSYVRIPEDVTAIKRAILQYGAVTFVYKSPSAPKYYSTSQYSDHTSLIVGWDDNMAKENFRPQTPSADGAWIVKNSWGNYGYESNGTYCFYCSYELPIGTLYAVDVEMREDYQNLYYYDGGIIQSMRNYAADAQAAVYEAKLSTAAREERLKAVMIATPQGDLDVNVKIYKNLDVNPANVNDARNVPVGDAAAAERQVHIDNMGMHTIDLEEPLPLGQGEFFSIVVCCKDRFGNVVPVVCAVDSAKSVNDMTYYLSGGTWHSYKGGGAYADSSTDNMAARIRAITDTVEREADLGKDLAYARAEIADPLVYYEKGKKMTPEVEVYFGESLLEEGRDYTLAFPQTLAPGMATVTIAGCGDYRGERRAYYEVAKAESPPGGLSGTIEVFSDTLTLYDIPLPPNWQWAVEDRKLEAGMNACPDAVEYVGEDRAFFRKLTCGFTVNKTDADPPPTLDITAAVVTVEGEYCYTGGPVVPSVTVLYEGAALRAGVDFILTCRNNVNAGTATAVITGNGRFFGEITREFAIGKADWPAERPPESLKFSGKTATLGEIPLGCENWAWEDPDFEVTGDRSVQTAVYTGADGENYLHTRAEIVLCRDEEVEEGGNGPEEEKSGEKEPSEGEKEPEEGAEEGAKEPEEDENGPEDGAGSLWWLGIVVPVAVLVPMAAGIAVVRIRRRK